MLNFGNEPGLKSEISACGPSARSWRRGAFFGITRGLHAAQGGPSITNRAQPMAPTVLRAPWASPVAIPVTG